MAFTTMTSESDLIELIFLAGIAIILIYRLITALGQRDGFEQSQPVEIYEEGEDIFSEHEKGPVVQEQDSALKHLNPSLIPVIEEIKQIDRAFHLGRFMDGAVAAYEMIVDAFSKGDLVTLKELLDRKIFAEFQTAIKERVAKNHTLDATIVRIVKVWIEDASLKGDKAFITVGFTTEQTHTVKDHHNNLIEGDPHQIEEITDIWTFNRSLKSGNPNWVLVETAS